MGYVLALIGAVAIAVLMWKAFGPDGRAGLGGPGLGRPAKPLLAPDDDPEFLRRLGEDDRRHRDGEDPPTS